MSLLPEKGPDNMISSGNNANTSTNNNNNNNNDRELNKQKEIEKLSKLSKDRTNKYDIFGRNLLHLAATIGNANIVDALLENIHIDTSICDLENNWTPLHRALADGNISAAQLIWNRELASTQDRSKSFPTDLLNSLIKLDIGDYTGGTEVFTFGSNANHTLGVSDSDDRAHPARIKLKRYFNESCTLRQKIKPTTIKDVAISKLHSAVLADGHLYICGVARGGRLGLGTSTNTQFAFEKVDIENQVLSVALGLDHTVAVCGNGDVYTWGSNKSAQLGYTTDLGLQNTPRKVLTNLDMKKSHMTKCSASKFHTVVYNETEMYSWGVNIGQMGFTSTPDPKVGANIVENGGITEIHPRKMVTTHGIVQVVATDVATIVLFDNDDVRVYMNYGNFRVSIPTTDRDLQFDKFRPRNFHSLQRVVQIAASNNGTCCMVTNFGSILQFQLEKFVKSEQSMTQLSKQVKVNTVWKGRTDQMRAKYVDVSDDGSFIVCVENGSVWKRKRNKRGTVIERVPLVNRIHRVCCDSNFGSFVVVRQDMKLEPVDVRLEELADDLESCMSFVSTTNLRKSRQLLRMPMPKRIPTLFNFNDQVENIEDNDDDEEKEEHDIDKYILAAFSQRVQNMDERDDCNFFFKVDERSIPIHSAIVKSRIPYLKSVNLSTVEKGSEVVFDKKVSLETVIVLYYYLYTDNLIPIWNSVGYSYNQLAVIRDQVAEIAGGWKLDALRNAVLRRQYKPRPTLYQANLIKFSPDITINCSNGTLKAHGFLLSSRSAYFEAQFSDRWSVANNTVNFSHVSTQVFEILLEYLYTDKIHSLFDINNSISTSKQFVKLVLEVLKLGNELSIIRLKEICESILCSFVSVKNCGIILAQAVKYHADQLRDRVLYYINYNIDCLLENNFLSGLDNELFQLIDKHMRLMMNKTWQMPESVFWRALDDPIWHDELSCRFIPIFGASYANNVLTKKQRRQSSFNNTELEKEKIQQTLSIDKEKEKMVPQQQPVSPPQSTPTKPASSPVPSTTSTATTSSTPIKISTPTKQPPSTTTPEPVKIGDLFKQSPEANNQNNSPSRSKVVIEAPKLSQKARRKQQRQQSFSSDLSSSPSTSAPPPAAAAASTSASSPWGSVSQPIPTSSPFDELKNIKNKSPIASSLSPSGNTLRDIIQQEQRTVQKRQQEQTRSLKEIQEQEEFEKWFQEETERYQQEMKQHEEASIPRQQSQKSGRGGGGRGRGRGRGGGNNNNNNNSHHRGRGRKKQEV